MNETWEELAKIKHDYDILFQRYNEQRKEIEQLVADNARMRKTLDRIKYKEAKT